MSQAQAIPRAEPIPVDALEELVVRPRRYLAAHVGIAVSGSSFISATTRGVRVQPIGSYWGRSYVGARRVV